MPKSRRGAAGAKNGNVHAGASSDNPNRTADKKAKASGSALRSKATINRLNMYRTKVKRGKDGKITKGGLPVGVQFASGLGDERTLLELAFELEAARPWAQRRPSLWAPSRV